MRLFSSLLTSSFLLVGPLTTAAAPAAQVLDDSSPLGFYETRPDDRKCNSIVLCGPACGGVFLRPIDGSLMTCPYAEEPMEECYVVSIRYSSMLDEPPPPPLSSSEIATGQSILYGRIVSGNYESAPDYYDFEVQDGTIAATSQQIILSYRVSHDDGGFWLDSLTTTMTLCSDGVVQESCFVGNFNVSGLGLTTPEEEQVVMDQLRYGPSLRVVQGYYIENPEYENTNWSEEKDLYVLEVSVPAP